MDRVLYLPLDQKINAHLFLEAVDPCLALFVKYDFWYHYLSQLVNRQIPFAVVAANFRTNHFLFRSTMRPILSLLKEATALFVQNDTSIQTLKQRGFTNALVAGDPRIDRVLANQPDSQICTELDLAGFEHVVVFGSLWLEDLEIVRPWIEEAVADPKTFVIIAPHDLSDKNIRLIQHNAKVFRRLSEVRGGEPLDPAGLIVDTIGDLSSLYHCAHLAYIGGGFGHGIHNILEPAAAHIPILFGPKHDKFPEADELIQLNCAFAVQSSAEVAATLRQLETIDERKRIAADLAVFLEKNRGATETIVTWLEAHNFIPA